jgi:hypothetical protein
MKVVAVQECSDGNESVGNEWVETAIFDSLTTAADILLWAKKQHGAQGRLMLTIPREGKDS